MYYSFPSFLYGKRGCRIAALHLLLGSATGICAIIQVLIWIDKVMYQHRNIAIC